MNTTLLLCRPGFEGDCAAELAARDPQGFARARRDEGWLTWESSSEGVPLPLIFARTGFKVTEAFHDLPDDDRLGALLPVLRRIGPVAGVRLEHADTNEGRGLQRFLRRFRTPLESALRREALLRPGRDAFPTLHLFFIDSSRGYAGLSRPEQSGAWENGIPRLRMPAQAPSRSAAKIEEGWLRLMSTPEREHWLRSPRTAVDLGAAPGGWTWQLARHGVKVTGVDHGRLQDRLMDEFPVRHVSADAFTWRPPKPVDWLVCDVVDKPARTLALMEKWLTRGWCRLALFNLKLPMKQRYATVEELLGRLAASLPEGEIRAAQLYHDREEITVVVLPGSRD